MRYIGLLQKKSAYSTVLLSGMVAKVAGFLNQIFSTYLLAEALGEQGLKLQMFALSFVGWFYLSLFGMSTSLPALLVKEQEKPDSRERYIQSAFLAASVCALATLTIALLSKALITSPTVAQAPIVAAATCNALLLFFSLSEQIFLVDHKASQFNLLNAFGTAVSLFATFILTLTKGGSSAFVVAYYVGMLLPTAAAGCFVLFNLSLVKVPKLSELHIFFSRLLSVGGYGHGYGLALYCKTQAPLMILDFLGRSEEIASVGMGLRFSTLMYSSASIFFPVFFSGVADALRRADFSLYGRIIFAALTLWVGLLVGIWALFASYGSLIFELWTRGSVSIDYAGCLAIALFSSSLLGQYLLFAVTTPDLIVTERLRWLFWIEAFLVPLFGAIGAHFYGGVGLFVAMSNLVLVSTIVTILTMLSCRKLGG